jgi:hypothetical protein
LLGLYLNTPDVREMAAPGDTSLTLTVQTVHMASSEHGNHSNTAVSTVPGLWAPDLDCLLLSVTYTHWKWTKESGFKRC